MNEADSIRLHGAASIGRLFVLLSTNQNKAASEVYYLLSADVVFLASSLARCQLQFFTAAAARPHSTHPPPLSFSLGERKLSKKNGVAVANIWYGQQLG
jgi:hypothetical protein